MILQIEINFCNKIVSEISIANIENENVRIEKITKFYKKNCRNPNGKKINRYRENDGIAILSKNDI